jgi:transposase
MPAYKAPTDSERCTALTAGGRRCKRFRVAGTELCEGHSTAPGGAPTKLDEATVTRILSVLRVGGYPEAAAGVAGIHVKTLYKWMRRGHADGEDPADAPYRAFRSRVEQARAEGETRNVALIAQAAAQNWQAAAWLLERQFPERWARVSQRTERDEPAPAAAPDPFAEVDELAARRTTH